MSTTTPSPPVAGPAPGARSARAARRRHRPGLGAALRWELLKLRAQLRVRAVLIGAVLVPVAVVVVVHSQPRPPKDTLFGRFATDDGFAMALLVLGFATQWVLPLLASLVAGDVLASEDQHGTWKTVLTRSTSRASLFWAKAVAATGLAVVVVLLLTASTVVTSLLVVGRDPLTGLSGQTIEPHAAVLLVVLAWLSTLPAVAAFACLALLFSAWSRNAAAGVAAPVVLGLLMQLLGALGGAQAVRPYLLTTPLEAWHGLLAEPRFTGPLVQGLLVSAGWAAVCLAAALVLVRRRDITGG